MKTLLTNINLHCLEDVNIRCSIVSDRDSPFVTLDIGEAYNTQICLFIHDPKVLMRLLSACAEGLAVLNQHPLSVPLVPLVPLIEWLVKDDKPETKDLSDV